MNDIVDGATFRRVLGHYPTGVCAITALTEDGPVGMIVGSFTSVSLDPPLVGFFPDKASTTWPKIAAVGRFCVNVLAEDQHEACRALASRAERKFDLVAHGLSPAGNPLLDDVVAAIDCDLHDVHEAGDHLIVLGLVRTLEARTERAPLLFFKGGYGRFRPDLSD